MLLLSLMRYTTLPGIAFLLFFFSGDKFIYAIEVLRPVGLVKRSEPILFASTCTERCHVNFMAYESKFEASQRGEIFRHKTHSFGQNLDCTSCHVDNEVNTEGHGKLTIKTENCSKCHHASEEAPGCTQCHREPYEFLQGKSGMEGVVPLPDMMSRAVKCEDCHRYNDEELKFRGVEEYCIKCHNDDYGKLYNAWIKTIEERLEKYNRRVQNLVEDSNVALLNKSDINKANEMESGGVSELDTFINKTGATVDLITKYGTHNFNLTEALLDKLEEEIALYYGRVR